MCTTAFLQIYPVSLDSVFTEILRNRIDRNRNCFGFVWTGASALEEVMAFSVDRWCLILEVEGMEDGCNESQ